MTAAQMASVLEKVGNDAAVAAVESMLAAFATWVPAGRPTQEELSSLCGEFLFAFAAELRERGFKVSAGGPDELEDLGRKVFP